MYTRNNDPEGRIMTIGLWDDDRGFIIVAEDVNGEYAPLLAQASTLYHELTRVTAANHLVGNNKGHQGTTFRECPMVSCERATRALLGADKQGPLI
jgi:hypothetical protein